MIGNNLVSILKSNDMLLILFWLWQIVSIGEMSFATTTEEKAIEKKKKLLREKVY